MRKKSIFPFQSFGSDLLALVGLPLFFFFFSNLFIAIYLTLLFALKNESTSRLNISISPGLLFSFTKAVAKFVHYLAP